MEKINVAELLKYCPQGMELDCTMLDDVVFEKISFGVPNYPIVLKRLKTNTTTYLTKYGQYSTAEDYKCIIFPKGKTTWKGFVPPCKFKDGDIVFYNDTIAIFKEWGDETLFRTYVTKYLCCDFCIDVNVPLFGKSVRREIRFATEEEKENLFTAIKEQGYKWNAETKTLEKLIKPKFKVGDRVKHISSHTSGIIVKVTDKNYFINYPKGESVYVNFTLEKDYELAPNKFDINDLIPFESKVLVRSYTDDLWKPAVFGLYIKKDYIKDNLKFAPYYVQGGTYWEYCIPYEGNEHLLGTTDDCSEYFKTWE